MAMAIPVLREIKWCRLNSNLRVRILSQSQCLSWLQIPSLTIEAFSGHFRGFECPKLQEDQCFLTPYGRRTSPEKVLLGTGLKSYYVNTYATIAA